MEYLDLIIGLVVGALIGWLIGRARSRGGAVAVPESTSSELAVLEERVASRNERLTELGQRHEALSAEHIALGETHQAIQTEFAGVRAELTARDQSLTELRERLATSEATIMALTGERDSAARKAAELGAEMDTLREAHEQRVQDIKGARDNLVDTFKSTAAQVLKDTREQSSKEQRERLETTLSPFQDQLKGFKELVAKTYETEGRDRVALKKEVELLAERNRTLASEAERLTNALTGSTQVRGEWGEITLKRILEHSGLREGEEFRLQESTTLDDGQRLRPDVVISLPEDGALVIDSKLQLVAWSKVANAADQDEAAVGNRELVQAIRTHMRTLDRKAYARLYDTSVDMVVMYIPIDAAVLSALAAEPGLYDEAYACGVVLTGPTMLMALLSSLAHQWRGKHQERNVLKIAKMAEALGKKLETFLSSYETIGQRFKQGVEAYNKGLNQLATGNGNVLKKVADLGDMGIKSAQQINVDWETLSIDVVNLPEQNSVDE